MLAGVVPFSGDNATTIMNQHLTVSPGLPSKLNPSIPPKIEAIIMKSIRKNPKERFQSAESFLYDLKNYNELDISYFPTKKEKVTGVITNRQMWVLSGLIALVFFAIVAVIVLIGLLGHH